mgnify:CR=1 FL=1
MEELGYTVLKKDENGNELREIDYSKTRAVANRGRLPDGPYSNTRTNDRRHLRYADGRKSLDNPLFQSNTVRRIWLSSAKDIEKDLLWYPSYLKKSVVDAVGPVPCTSMAEARNEGLYNDMPIRWPPHRAHHDFRLPDGPYSNTRTKSYLYQFKR